MKKDKKILPEIVWPEMERTFADFFCGCGGFSLGMIEAGMKCISAMDFDPAAVASYWYNLCMAGWSHLFVDLNNPDIAKLKKHCSGATSNDIFGDIPDNWTSSSVTEPMPCLNLFMYSINDLEPEEWMEMCKVRAGDISVFVGGPPCQGFSMSNSNRHVGDERNQLPLRFIYYCKVCRPKYVIIENVPGILTLGKAKKDKEGPFPMWIREKFEDAGYDMAYEVLNAADYGVPQRRKRVFFIATRKDVAKVNLFPAKTHGEGLLPHVTVKEAIGDQPPMRPGDGWGWNVLHPYGLNPHDGYVICARCCHYNRNSRLQCHNCGADLQDAITGGVLVVPEMGYLFDIKTPIDNNYLRENYSEIYKNYKYKNSY